MKYAVELNDFRVERDSLSHCIRDLIGLVAESGSEEEDENLSKSFLALASASVMVTSELISGENSE